MRHLTPLVAFFMALIATAPAFGEDRLALVIGNGAYRNVPALDNPVNDARLMARTLEDVGFRVTMITEADRATMERAVERFGEEVRAARPGSVALFHFAGHGVRSDGFNFLVPVNVSLRSEGDMARETVAAEWIIERMKAPGVTSVMVLDACRNNPFDDRGPEFGDGLARMQAKDGNLIAYATGPGDIALDGVGNNSPYTAALARAIRQPGLDLDGIFEQVRDDVVSATGGEQVPWETSALDRAVFIRSGQSDNAPVARQEDAVDTPLLRLELTFNSGPMGRENPDCNGIYRYDPIPVQASDSQRIASANGIVDVMLEISTVGDGELGIAPVAGDKPGRMVTFRLSDVVPEKTHTVFSQIRHPELPECGQMNFYVTRED